MLSFGHGEISRATELKRIIQVYKPTQS
jgi:hypothetical protein